MPQLLKELVVVLVLASVVFAFAKAPACALATRMADFERRRNLWFGITLAAFLAGNFWVFIGVSAALLLATGAREPNKLALYFLLLFAVPPIDVRIPGLGLVDHLFEIDHFRLLSLVILLPVFLSLRAQPGTARFGSTTPDKLLAAYLILRFLLRLEGDSLTNALRAGVFYPFLDAFLPYYVASRSLRDLQGFRDAAMAFAVAAAVLCAIGTFEFARQWLLYARLDDALGTAWEYGGYLRRGEALRAIASTGGPIILGYIIVVAMGLYLYLRRSVENSAVWSLGFGVLLAGLVAALSRGPWVGAIVLLLVYSLAGPSPGRAIARIGLLGAIVLPVFLLSPAGETLVDYLPFVGTVDAANVTYRQQLFLVAVQVVLDYPIFGTQSAMHLEEMQQLVQGQGIIDPVNTFVLIALNSGLVGLSLFSGFFVAVAVGILKAMRTLVDRSDERYLLGRALFSILLAILVIIATVSPILAVPVIYWTMAGLGVGYARMLALSSLPDPVVRAGARATMAVRT